MKLTLTKLSLEVQYEERDAFKLNKLKGISLSCQVKETRILVVNLNGEEYVVVKGAVPKSLKLQFKVLCVQKELEMSAVLEDLVKQWIQADAPVHESISDLSGEDSEDVKGYVPKSLKLHFKTLCTLKRVKMRFVLYQLINEWVQAQ